MIETKDVVIGDDTMTIRSLPATRALSIAARLLKVMGGIGMGMKDFTLKPEEFAEAFHMGNMMQGLIQNIDADGAPELIRQVVRESLVSPSFEPSATKKETNMEGAEQRFNEWYDDRFSRGLDDLLALLYEIFSWNYGDPVDWIKKTLARAIENGLLTLSVPSSEETTSQSEPVG